MTLARLATGLDDRRSLDTTTGHPRSHREVTRPWRRQPDSAFHVDDHANTMGASENFCLRWNDFESNVSGAFRDLRAESDFFDVTLACDESGGRTLQAHRVILSACSSFFKQMLRSTAVAAPGHPNPLIYLRGVRLHDLEAVLDFIYHGEVNVAQEDLNSFLAVAEDLQIKGLTQQPAKDTPVTGRRPTGRKSLASSASAGGPSAKKRRRGREDEEETISRDFPHIKKEPAAFDRGPMSAEARETSTTAAAFVEDATSRESVTYGDETYDDTFGLDDDDEAGGDEEGLMGAATAGIEGGDSTKGKLLGRLSLKECIGRCYLGLGMALYLG